MSAHARSAWSVLGSEVERDEQPQRVTAGFGRCSALTDGLIHQRDIRRPLGRPRAIPLERRRAARGGRELSGPGEDRLLPRLG